MNKKIIIIIGILILFLIISFGGFKVFKSTIKQKETTKTEDINTDTKNEESPSKNTNLNELVDMDLDKPTIQNKGKLYMIQTNEATNFMDEDEFNTISRTLPEMAVKKFVIIDLDNTNKKLLEINDKSITFILTEMRKTFPILEPSYYIDNLNKFPDLKSRLEDIELKYIKIRIDPNNPEAKSNPNIDNEKKEDILKNIKDSLISVNTDYPVQGYTWTINEKNKVTLVKN